MRLIVILYFTVLYFESMGPWLSEFFSPKCSRNRPLPHITTVLRAGASRKKDSQSVGVLPMVVRKGHGSSWNGTQELMEQRGRDTKEGIRLSLPQGAHLHPGTNLHTHVPSYALQLGCLKAGTGLRDIQPELFAGVLLLFAVDALLRRDTVYP